MLRKGLWWSLRLRRCLLRRHPARRVIIAPPTVPVVRQVKERRSAVVLPCFILVEIVNVFRFSGGFFFIDVEVVAEIKKWHRFLVELAELVNSERLYGRRLLTLTSSKFAERLEASSPRFSVVLLEGCDRFFVQTQAVVQSAQVVRARTLTLEVHQLVGSIDRLFALTHLLMRTCDCDKDTLVIRCTLLQHVKDVESFLRLLIVELDLRKKEISFQRARDILTI